mgnify:CR=1 FL=1
MTDPLNIIFNDFGLRQLGYRLGSVVYILRKGIISQVCCGYEVQINIYKNLSESPPLIHTVHNVPKPQ